MIGKKPLLLIVDDEERMRKLLGLTMAGGAYEIAQAKDGVSALEVAKRDRPACVLLDVMMPGLDGIEVCRRIKGDPQLRGTRVVMLTALAQSEVEKRATAAGADGVLTKPFSPIRVIAAVEKAMGVRA